MRYLVRAFVILVAFAVMLTNPVIAVSPSGPTYLFWNFVADIGAVLAVSASAATWRTRIA